MLNNKYALIWRESLIIKLLQIKTYTSASLHTSCKVENKNLSRGVSQNQKIMELIVVQIWNLDAQIFLYVIILDRRLYAWQLENIMYNKTNLRSKTRENLKVC